MQVALIVLALAACVAAAPGMSYDKPKYTSPSYDKGYGRNYDYAPANYKFDYVVKDDYSYVNYGQNEERYGDNTKGYYFNYLPKGSHQTFNYVIDGKSYSGYAPEYSNYKQSPKAYVASPVYDKVEYQNKNYLPAAY